VRAADLALGFHLHVDLLLKCIHAVRRNCSPESITRSQKNGNDPLPEMQKAPGFFGRLLCCHSATAE
jgi:hypothetical protein